MFVRCITCVMDLFPLCLPGLPAYGTALHVCVAYGTECEVRSVACVVFPAWRSCSMLRVCGVSCLMFLLRVACVVLRVPSQERVNSH